MARGSTNFPEERCGSRFGLLQFFAALLLFYVLSSRCAFAANTITTIGNPANTTIDIFDYYIYDDDYNSTAQYPPDSVDGQTGNRLGINGWPVPHALIFRRNTGKGKTNANQWTDTNGPATQGIVQPFLADGYPVLNCDSPKLNCVSGNESLSYLFDRNDIIDEQSGKPAKLVYADVNSLFTVDKDGYYIFDSVIHNGYINTVTCRIPDTPCEATVESQTNGQFFPVTNGVRPNHNTTPTNPEAWFFGVHIKSEFSIPQLGQVQNQNGEYEDMKYHFTGDDDVWVYIDDVLIGDLGGIHSKNSLDIDFVTGQVLVKTANGTVVENTTIFEKVKQAFSGTDDEKKQQAIDYFAAKGITWRVDDDGVIRTFDGSTYHTLDFFYLERGGGSSNMEMKYNLVSTYDFTAHKSLYRTNNDPILAKDDFRYRLTGFPAEYDGKLMDAIMPKQESRDSACWYPKYNQSPKMMIACNSMDGNINFGGMELTDAQIREYAKKPFRYMIEELPPDGAIPASGAYVLYDEDDREKYCIYIPNNGGYDCSGEICDGNVSTARPEGAEPISGSYRYNNETVTPNPDGSYTFDGKNYDFYPYTVDPETGGPKVLPPAGAKYQGAYIWQGKIIEQNPDGTYTFGNITYDSTVYYFEGTLDNREVGEPDTYYLYKTYYTDETYSVRKNVSFAGFNNRYNSLAEADLKAVKELFTPDGAKIQPAFRQFPFDLVDITDTDKNKHKVIDPPSPKAYPPSNSEDGTVSFTPIMYSADKIPSGNETTYTYMIKERTNSDQFNYLPPTQYYARVHLTKAADGTLSAEVKYYRKYEGEGCPETGVTFRDENVQEACFTEIGESVPVFRNQEKAESKLTVVKLVDGEIGSKNKTFEFTVNIPNAAGGKFWRRVNNNDPERIIFEGNGNAPVISLRHNESVSFYGVTGTFTVTETIRDSYETAIVSNDSGTHIVSDQRRATGSIMLAETETITYTNTLPGETPTGIRDDLKPALIGLAAALMLLLTLWIGKGLEDGD